MSIADQNRMRALEAAVEALEARIAVLERAESYAASESQEPPRRGPGRPRKQVESTTPA